LKIALLGAGLAAGFAASAGADIPALPTVTLPTVTLPTVTLPTVTLTTPPAPVPPLPPPPPVQVPPAPPPATPPALPAPPSLLGGGQGGATQRGGAEGATGSGTGAAGAPEAPGAPAASASGSRTAAAASNVYRLRTSRDWIAKRGPKRQRHTTLVFVLRNPSLVRFDVVQVSPDCRRFAHFRVVGHRGVNRVRLGPRVGRHTLRPGTYKLIARAVPGGRTVVDTRLVVVRTANRDQIEQARGADTCPKAARSSGQSTAAGASSSTAGPTGSGFSKTAAAEKSQPARQHQGVLGAKFARKAVEAARSVPLWLYLLLVLAIALLAAAALPLRAAPTTGAASALARHRGVLAVAGAATLVAVMVTYVLL
jgi:hypothetical protein